MNSCRVTLPALSRCVRSHTDRAPNGTVIAAVLAWVQQHPWKSERQIRTGVGSDHNTGTVLQRLMTRGVTRTQLIDDEGAHRWHYAMVDTPSVLRGDAYIDAMVEKDQRLLALGAAAINAEQARAVERRFPTNKKESQCV